jgi:hypothetical protein
VILIKVRLEWRGTGTILWLVAKRSASVEVEVVVVGSDLALTLLHAPEHQGNATKKECTANATNHAANNLLVGVAQAAVVAVVAVLRRRRFRVCRLTSGDGDGVCAGGCNVHLLAVAECRADSGSEWLEGCRDEIARPYDGYRTDGCG